MTLRCRASVWAGRLGFYQCVNRATSEIESEGQTFAVCGTHKRAADPFIYRAVAAGDNPIEEYVPRRNLRA